MIRGSPDAVGFAPRPTQENNLIGTVTLPLNNVGLFLYRDRSRILHQLFHIKWLKIIENALLGALFLFVACLKSIVLGVWPFSAKKVFFFFPQGVLRFVQELVGHSPLQPNLRSL